MTTKELQQYLLQSLNMALSNQIQGESSYTNIVKRRKSRLAV